MRIKYREYTRRARRASQLVERSDYDGAIAILEELVSSDISDVDKAMMCLNIAIVYDKMGRIEEALDWYATGASYERSHDRHYVAERQAAYLAEQERYAESLAHYEGLVTRSSLTEADRERITKNIERLRKR